MAQPVETLTAQQQADLRNYFGLANVLFDTSFQNVVAGDSPVALTSQGIALFVDCSAGSVVIKLPAISGTEMQQVCIKRTDESANTLTIQKADADAGSVTIDGDATQLVPKLGAATIRGNTVAWFITDFSVNNAMGVLPGA